MVLNYTRSDPPQNVPDGQPRKLHPPRPAPTHGTDRRTVVGDNAPPSRNPNRPKVGDLLSATMGFAERRDPGRHMCGLAVSSQCVRRSERLSGECARQRHTSSPSSVIVMYSLDKPVRGVNDDTKGLARLRYRIFAALCRHYHPWSDAIGGLQLHLSIRQ